MRLGDADPPDIGGEVIDHVHRLAHDLEVTKDALGHFWITQVMVDAPGRKDVGTGTAQQLAQVTPQKAMPAGDEDGLILPVT